MPKKIFLLFSLIFFIQNILLAKITLPPLFSDNMVLQQNAHTSIWGKADPLSTVKIVTSWNNKSYNAVADKEGNFKIKIATVQYGGPYTITLTQGNTVILKNILLGEVWLCSGQSNMEMPLDGWGKVNNYQQEIASATYSQIRLLQIERSIAEKPIKSIVVRNNGWGICSPQSIADFSATAYFFAREIYLKTKIPIGLIHSSWGGTVAEAWTSYPFLKSFENLYASATLMREGKLEATYVKAMKEFIDWEDKMRVMDQGFKNADTLWASESLNTSDWKTMQLPDTWENKGLINFDGIIWFRKTVHIPRELKGKDLYLDFIADDDDIAWINGKKIGKTYGWAEKRNYKIPKELIREGENTIVIRVFDTGGGGGIYSDNFTLNDNVGNTLKLSGEWKYKIGYTLSEVPKRPESSNGPNRPTVLYNAMIFPLTNYTIKGVIWYQGESNVERSTQYQTLFPTLINCWRSTFNNNKMPFYFVQLANYLSRDSMPVNSQWALLREAQAMATQLNNTGMAVAIDIGNALDIHPKNKQEVGRRLALNALVKQYKKEIEFSGPVFESYAIEENKIRIKFSHAKGMKSNDGKHIKGFAIAGADKKFYWADASIQGDEIVVENSKVEYPLAVRYAWGNNPEVNLYNDSNLPAVPFRTDNW